jgi:hypothetical protein
MKNPLRVWFEQFPRPMLQKDFAKLCGISQSFLTALLDDAPPWPMRATLNKITEITKGAVTADMWAKMPDPPPRKVVLDLFGNPMWSAGQWRRFIKGLEPFRAELQASIARSEMRERAGILSREELTGRDNYTGEVL